jgi:ABC-type multidrug transport system fused ATPase/permease subunit
MIAQHKCDSNRDQVLAFRLKQLEATFLRPFRSWIAFALILMWAQSLLLLPLPWLQGWIIDQLRQDVTDQAHAALLQQIALICALSVACLVVRMALSWLSGSIMNRVSLDFVRTLTDSLHRKLQRLPLAFFDRHNTGDLMARLTNDVGTLLIFLNSSSLQLVADLVLAVGIVGGLVFLSWPLAAISFLALPLFLWNHRRFAKTVWRLSRAVQEKTADIYSLLSERISGVRTIRAFGTERAEVAFFRQRLDEHSQQSHKNLNAASLQSFSASAISGLSTVALVISGAMFVQRGAHTTGRAVAFLTYLGLLYQPLVRLTQFYGGISATLAAVDRITELLAQPEPAIPRRRLFRHHLRGELRIQNVSFRYRDSAPLVLRQIDLTIEPGMTVGLWGPSGSGKSTLLSLLPRLYGLAPDQGRILLDGRDTRTIHPSDLRRNVILIPQHARLFEGTIRYNLTYGARDVNSRLIWRALEAVDLAELVNSLPAGLETVVGERGATLSGGQRQRLALARGLIARPPVLLLDDSTSALDARTEAYVGDQIAEFCPHQTRIVVSHKRETLRQADSVVVIDHGRVIATEHTRHLMDVALRHPQISASSVSAAARFR